MKRFVKKYLLVMVVSLSSCQFLEKFPDSNADVRIDTKEKVQELLTGAYRQHGDHQAGAGHAACRAARA